MFHQERLRAVRKIVGEDTRSRLMNKTVSDPDMSTIERENQFKRKPLSSARSNNDVSSTPTPTPRRVSPLWSLIFIYSQKATKFNKNSHLGFNRQFTLQFQIGPCRYVCVNLVTNYVFILVFDRSLVEAIQGIALSS